MECRWPLRHGIGAYKRLFTLNGTTPHEQIVLGTTPNHNDKRRRFKLQHYVAHGDTTSRMPEHKTIKTRTTKKSKRQGNSHRDTTSQMSMNKTQTKNRPDQTPKTTQCRASSSHTLHFDPDLRFIGGPRCDITTRKTQGN